MINEYYCSNYIALNYLERFRYVNPAVLLLLKLEDFIHLVTIYNVHYIVTNIIYLR